MTDSMTHKTDCNEAGIVIRLADKVDEIHNQHAPAPWGKKYTPQVWQKVHSIKVEWKHEIIQAGQARNELSTTCQPVDKSLHCYKSST